MLPYLVPKGTPAYGIQCFNHSYAFGYVTIDKITISAPAACFNIKTLPSISHPAFELLRYGEYVSVALSGEMINPNAPMYLAVIQVFQFLLYNNAFALDIGNMLYVYLNYCGNFSMQPGFEGGFLATLIHLGFTFSKLELAFDMVPVTINDPSRIRQVRDTYYSTDYHKSSSGNQASLICIYNKGNLLKEQSCGYPILPPYINYMRLEYRIGGWNGRRWLHISDLRHNMRSYIEAYGDRIKRKADKLVGKALSFNSSWIPPELLKHLLTIQPEEYATPAFPY